MAKKHNIRNKNPNWKGGRYKTKDGYIMLNLPNHPKAKYNRPYIAEHILIVEAFLGKFLKGKECVHHINHNKEDNRIQNLMVFPNAQEHKKFENKEIQFGLTRPMLKQIEERWQNLK